MDSYPPRYSVTCEFDGKIHRGTYWLAGKILTVSVASGKGGTSKQIGSMEPEVLAKQLLTALAQAGKT